MSYVNFSAIKLFLIHIKEKEKNSHILKFSCSSHISFSQWPHMVTMVDTKRQNTSIRQKSLLGRSGIKFIHMHSPLNHSRWEGF